MVHQQSSHDNCCSAKHGSVLPTRSCAKSFAMTDLQRNVACLTLQSTEGIAVTHVVHKPAILSGPCNFDCLASKYGATLPHLSAVLRNVCVLESTVV